LKCFILSQLEDERKKNKVNNQKNGENSFVDSGRSYRTYLADIDFAMYPLRADLHGEKGGGFSFRANANRGLH
jgi:hypothetical protein